MIKGNVTGILAAGVLIFFLAAPAWAHKVIVFAWAERGQVFVEAGFGGKQPAMDCAFKVLDPTGKVLVEGKTDDHGKASFDMPPGDLSSLTVNLTAGPAHMGSWTLTHEELVEGRKGAPEITEAQAEARRPEDLDHGPSPLKIIIGLGVIFALAFLGTRFSRKRSGKRA